MLNSKLTTLILIAICTILGNMIYYQIKNPREILPADPTGQTGEIKLETTAVGQVKSLADIGEFAEVIERPLFSSDRRPTAEIIEQEVIHKSARNPDLKLTGVVLSDDGSIALIKSRKNPKLQRIKLEESINGWKLIEINSGSVQLESGKQQITLEMTRKSDPSQARKKTLLQAPANKQQTLLNNNKQSRQAIENHDGMKTTPAIPEKPQGVSSDNEKD